MGPYKAIDVANAFIDLADKSGEQLSHLKLQKLLYFAQGWYLAINNTPLINEQVEAWKYGPVFESLFHCLKRYGADPITDRIPGVSKDPLSDTEDKAFLEVIWRAYGGYTAQRLSTMTHEKNGPWDKTWKDGFAPRGSDITFELLTDHFKRLLGTPEEAAA